ncbi:MAG: beta-N-acetylhexosaminidase, partial [Aestuariivirga sp.]
MKIQSFISGCEGTQLSASEIAFFREQNPWGLILFKRNCETPAQIKSLTSAFRDAVGRKDAPIFIDQEGGRVQRLGPPSNYWRKYPSARAYGDLYAKNPVAALRTARHVGRLMAEDLIEVGVTADCLPVLDIPQAGAHDVIGNRAYSLHLEQAMTLARAHTAGLMDGGVLPVMKHIPGHGRSDVDSHHELPVVKAKREDLEQVDFPPFAAFADAPMAMTAHVIYTALDKKAPATLSRKIIKSVIREQIGFRGLLITDDLSMKALSGTLTEKCSAALRAGCDMLLHCNGKLDEMREVAAAAGELKAKSLRRAKAALKSARKPQAFDKKAALK